MRTQYNPKNNPRVIIIQKLYGKFYNEDDDLDFPKHRFKKFIKDTVKGTIERDDVLINELNKAFENELKLNNLDKVFQIILKSATYEILYKPNLLFNSSKMRSFLSIVPKTMSLINFLNLCLGKSKSLSSL